MHKLNEWTQSWWKAAKPQLPCFFFLLLLLPFNTEKNKKLKCNLTLMCSNVVLAVIYASSLSIVLTSTSYPFVLDLSIQRYTLCADLSLKKGNLAIWLVINISLGMFPRYVINYSNDSRVYCAKRIFQKYERLVCVVSYNIAIKPYHSES